MSLQNDLEFLTANIVDAKSKPHLAPTLKSALESTGHDTKQVTEALNAFFSTPEKPRTLQ